VTFAPRGDDAALLAVSQTAALALGAGALAAFAGLTRPHWPRPRDLLVPLVATAAMALALWPLRALPPGALTLALQVAVGALVCGAVYWLTDFGGLRAVALARLRPRAA
jgi:hypothetical protein